MAWHERSIGTNIKNEIDHIPVAFGLLLYIHSVEESWNQKNENWKEARGRTLQFRKAREWKKQRRKRKGYFFVQQARLWRINWKCDDGVGVDDKAAASSFISQRYNQECVPSALTMPPSPTQSYSATTIPNASNKVHRYLCHIYKENLRSRVHNNRAAAPNNPIRIFDTNSMESMECICLFFFSLSS